MEETQGGRGRGGDTVVRCRIPSAGEKTASLLLFSQLVFFSRFCFPLAEQIPEQRRHSRVGRGRKGGRVGVGVQSRTQRCRGYLIAGVQAAQTSVSSPARLHNIPHPGPSVRAEGGGASEGRWFGGDSRPEQSRREEEKKSRFRVVFFFFLKHSLHQMIC